MTSADYAPSVQPLRTLIERIVSTCHEPLRIELQALVRLSEDELGRHARCHPDLFPQLHFALCQLRDTVLTHFDNEQALLFPSMRMLEDGASKAPQDLRRLVRELMTEQQRILTALASVKTATSVPSRAPVSPLLAMLLSTLRQIDRRLRAQLDLEQRELFPRATRVQDAAPKPLRLM